MDRYRVTFDTWNQIASLYEEKFMNLDLYNDGYDYFCGAINKSGAKVLEIGCGPGNIARYLYSVRPDLDLLGIDIAPNMLKLAKKNISKARFLQMDAREIDQLKESFDGIIAGFCLPYLSETDCSKLFADSYPLLNSNGVLYISFVEGHPSESRYLEGSTGLKTYFYYHQKTSLCKLLEEAHFRLEKVFEIQYPKQDMQTETHTVLIAKKQQK